MEDIQSSENHVPRPPPLLPFNCVQFVLAGSSVQEEESKKSKNLLPGDLNGKEVSDFYKDVISAPSAVQKRSKQSERVQHKIVSVPQKKESSSVIGKKDSDFFRNVQEGRVKDVIEFLRAGFSCNQIDQYGWTPLMIAACAGQKEMIECLLKEGADVECRNPQGMTARDIALKRNAPTWILDLLDPVYSRVLTIKEEKLDQVIERRTSFCDVCKKSYEDSQYDHERSIAHLFNSGHKKTRSTFYHIPESNKGFQLMLKEGWDKEKGLGPSGQGQKFPVKTVLRKDRSCIGTNRKEVPRITHFQPHDTTAVQRISNNRRPVIERERTLKKREREKVERKKRQKEINYRREFYGD